jgi:hypothetical protein
MSNCPCGECPSYNAHMRSLSVQRPAASERRRRDFALGADLAAYKALRRQGFQPPRIDGSYDLARRAVSEAEIRLGQVISDQGTKKRRGAKLMEAMTEISDHGMTGAIPEKGGKKRMPMRAR